VVTARARYAIYIQRMRVEEHRRRVGRLPENLASLGADPGVPVRWNALSDGSYELTVEAAGTALVYRSRMSADSFLGTALETLREAR
jgi:hypothetical protein